MRISPGSIKDDPAAISDLLEFVVEEAAICEFSLKDVFALTCRNLLIPCTFVSGQRTR